MAEPVHYIVPEGDIELNAGRSRATVRVRNTGDRPVQVGSHYHFFEANRELDFDRRTAYGMRLDIPAGTAVRFEPGDELVEIDFKEGVFVSNFTFSAGQFLQKKTYNFETKQVMRCTHSHARSLARSCTLCRLCGTHFVVCRIARSRVRCVVCAPLRAQARQVKELINSYLEGDD